MDIGQLPVLKEILRAPVGSLRYGYDTSASDEDVFILTPDCDMQIYDPGLNTAFFVVSVESFMGLWGHPVMLGNITGKCTGNKKLIQFIQDNRRDIIYSAPIRSVILGMEYIAQGERNGFNETIKPALRTAMVLSHMVTGKDDPFILNTLERETLSRARDGLIPAEERVGLYRTALEIEPLTRFMKCPGFPTIISKFESLLKEEVT